MHLYVPDHADGVLALSRQIWRRGRRAGDDADEALDGVGAGEDLPIGVDPSPGFILNRGGQLPRAAVLHEARRVQHRLAEDLDAEPLRGALDVTDDERLPRRRPAV